MMHRLFAATIMAATLGAQTPAFDAASVKSVSSAAVSRFQMLPGRVVGRNATARTIILAAYRLSPYQLTGGPAWLDADRFDLDANTTSTDREQMRRMLQTLLAERFQLVLRKESREMPVFALTVGKSGLRLSDSEPADSAPAGGRRGGGSEPTGGSMTDRLSMPAFAEMLSRDPRVGRPVLDMTGLTGTYVISFHWESDDDYINAIEEASGLRLEARKAPLDVFVVDRIAKPTAN